MFTLSTKIIYKKEDISPNQRKDIRNRIDDIVGGFRKRDYLLKEGFNTHCEGKNSYFAKEVDGKKVKLFAAHTWPTILGAGAGVIIKLKSENPEVLHKALDFKKLEKYLLHGDNS